MPSTPKRILDTHIHLWPPSALSPTSHAWMTPGHQLAKPHGVTEYLAAATDPALARFVYVETDRYLPSYAPEEEGEDALREWAEEPLEEVGFLRGIVEAGGREAALMKGCVLFAPFHLPHAQFQAYLRLAEGAAGPELWKRVVGFRYLLQGKGDGQVAELVGSEHWLQNVASLEQGRWVFEVGVDCHRDGTAGLEVVGEMIRELRKRQGYVRFVLNHLCKPALSSTAPDPHWVKGLEALSSDENVFMKLSGALNEFSTPTPSSVPDMLSALKPYTDIIFALFPNRVMFGSDWPVCNVGGPAGEDGNWGFWRDVVGAVLEKRRMSEEEREGVWYGVGEGCYRVEM